ncbi:MFS transporter [Ferruginivarius sediminum]|uniref:MFS transporter n=1 Tax=Ferruginivarius sediminum TaxID=2661937 RepID=A0A369TED1_9PROT|nr:MFS transporter [Ferruginivarius sediminum]RDD63202.1 MFS transporter [Ferruginivarius sediminum]
MTPAIRLTAAGFVATAVAFGPARMGFGLFLPAFREEFALSTSTAGMIASGGFLAFLLALLASAWLCRRHGERVSVITGALAAAAGFAAVAAAGTSGLLALGIALAGASAGLCWAPFNDAAERVVPDTARATALSVVSTGTTFGVAAAAGLALAVTEGALDWRGAWVGFALSGLALAGIALAGLPSNRGRKPAFDAGAAGPSLARRAVIPLYSTALCFGVTNAVFLSFAADRVVAAGGLPGLPDDAASAVIFLGYGFFGVLGLLTGRIEARTGLAPLFCAIFAAAALSLVLIALAPTSWSAVLAASGLHGVAIMMVSAVFSFWSLRLFPGRGTLGFTVTLLSVAAGSVLGPALAGLLAAAQGPQVMFLSAAAPPLAAALWFGARLRRARPRLPPVAG